MPIEVITPYRREPTKLARELEPGRYSAALQKLPVQAPEPPPAGEPSESLSPHGDSLREVLRGRRERRRAAKLGEAQARAREAHAQARARAEDARAKAFEAFEARELGELGADERDELEGLGEVERYGRPIPSPVWGMCRRIVRSRTPERTAQLWVRQALRRFSAVEVGQVVEAALCPDGRGGYHFDWSHISARRFLAVGLAKLRLAVELPARGGSKLCMRGISRGGLQEMMRDGKGHAPGDTWVSGYASQYGRRARASGMLDAERPLHHLGLLKRLERVGFERAVQLPAQAATVEEFERRPDRNGVTRCINRYYLHGREWAARAGAAVVDALTELARVACELRIRRAPRTASERLYAEKRDAEKHARARAPD